MSLKDRPKELAEETRTELNRKRLTPTVFVQSEYLEQKFTQAMNEAIEEIARQSDKFGYIEPAAIRELKIDIKDG